MVPRQIANVSQLRWRIPPVKCLLVQIHPMLVISQKNHRIQQVLCIKKNLFPKISIDFQNPRQGASRLEASSLHSLSIAIGLRMEILRLRNITLRSTLRFPLHEVNQQGNGNIGLPSGYLTQPWYRWPIKIDGFSQLETSIIRDFPWLC